MHFQTRIVKSILMKLLEILTFQYEIFFNFLMTSSECMKCSCLSSNNICCFYYLVVAANIYEGKKTSIEVLKIRLLW